MEIKLVWEMVIRLTGPGVLAFLFLRKKTEAQQIRHVTPKTVIRICNYIFKKWKSERERLPYKGLTNEKSS